MASEFGWIKPSERLVAKGYPTVIGEFEIETVSEMYPGRLVKKGTTASEIIVNDTSNNGTSLIGYLGYDECDMNVKPATRATIYKVNDAAPVLRGTFVGKATLSAQQTCTQGCSVAASSTSGQLDTATHGTDHVIGVALEAVTNVTGATSDIWVLFNF